MELLSALHMQAEARVQQARQLIEKIDQPFARPGNIWVVPLKNADAVKLAATLRGPGVSPHHAAVMVASAAPVSPAPQTSKPYMKEYFNPTIANRGSLPAQTARANDSETPMVARRVATTAEVARATQTALQQPAQPAGPMLASSRSVPAPAPSPGPTQFYRAVPSPQQQP